MNIDDLLRQRNAVARLVIRAWRYGTVTKRMLEDAAQVVKDDVVARWLLAEELARIEPPIRIVEDALPRREKKKRHVEAIFKNAAQDSEQEALPPAEKELTETPSLLEEELLVPSLSVSQPEAGPLPQGLMRTLVDEWSNKLPPAKERVMPLSSRFEEEDIYPSLPEDYWYEGINPYFYKGDRPRPVSVGKGIVKDLHGTQNLSYGVLTPDQYHDSIQRSPEQDRVGVRRLLLELFLLTVKDYQKYKNAAKGRKRRFYNEALEWLQSDEEWGHCSFVSVCYVLGLDVPVVRKALGVDSAVRKGKGEKKKVNPYDTLFNDAYRDAV